MRIADELAQLRAVVRKELRVEVRRQRHEVSRHLDLPRLPMRRRRAGEVWGVSMVRDEADVLPTTLEHLLQQGVDRVLIADNLSQDGTWDVLQELAARDSRVIVARDRLDAYHQDHKMTLLARCAARSGADWVVPFDADELWFAEHGTVGEQLRRLGAEPEVVATVGAPLHDTIPLARGKEPWDSGQFILNSTPVKWGKVAVRAHVTMRIHFGNHGAVRVGQARQGLRIAHLIYRGPEQLARKVRRGNAALDLATRDAGTGAHWRALAAISDDEVSALWADAQAGRPHPEVALNVGGPMVTCRPLDWPTWDPERLVTGTHSWSTS